MSVAGRWVCLVVLSASLCGGCGFEPEPPASQLALRLLPPVSDGRPLFPGERVENAVDSGPMPSAEARALMQRLEAAVTAGDGLAGVRLDVARGHLDAALRRLDETGFAADRAALDGERSAILLMRARRNDDPLDAVAALDLIPAANADIASRFNRFLAYCQLGLVRLADREQQGSLNDSNVALARLVKISPSGCGIGVAAEPSVESALSGRKQALEALHRGDSQPLRQWFDGAGLAAWLEPGDEAVTRELQEAAEILATIAADDSYQRLVAELDRSSPATRNAVRTALGLTMKAKSDFRQSRPEEALHLADEALAHTDRLATPVLAARARLEAIAAMFQLQDYSRAIAAAETLQQYAAAGGWNDLAGRAGWLAGLSRLQSGQFATAEGRFVAARKQFEIGIQPGLAATLATLEADALSELGDLRASLRLRISGLPEQRKAGLKEREAISLASGSVSLRVAGYARAALAFLDESEAALNREDDPLGEAELQMWRASGLIDVGDLEAGLAAAESGLESAARIGSEALRNRTIASIEAVRGRAEVDIDAPGAERDLTRAIHAARRHEFHIELGELLYHRARARRALRDDDGALADLEEALREGSRSASELDVVAERALLFDRERRIIDEAVSILAIDQGDAPRALEWALRLVGEASGVAAGAADIAQCRDAVESTLVLMALPDMLARWWCHDGTLAFDHRTIGRTDLQRAVGHFRSRVIAAEDPGEFASDAEALFKILLTPARDELARGRAVRLVLDGPLSGLPVAALRDIRDSMWLAERGGITEGVGLAGSQSGRPRPLTHLHALIVAAPALSGPLSMLFPVLPGARQEGELVASMLPGSLLLTGAAASKKLVLDGLDRYDVVHIAAHGMPRETDPGRAAVVLAGESDEAFLTAAEVARLKLHRARLVVLAACESGRGYETATLGSLSLAQGFLHAGVPDVLGTLWPIDDAAGREFMTVFYRELSTGSDPASALRGARVSLMHSADPKLRRPANWAGYFLANGTGRARGRER